MLKVGALMVHFERVEEGGLRVKECQRVKIVLVTQSQKDEVKEERERQTKIFFFLSVFHRQLKEKRRFN